MIKKLIIGSILPPTDEVNFCGHATVGLTWLLTRQTYDCKRKQGVVLETKTAMFLLYGMKKMAKSSM
ncbi:PhzF family phenazine biosynthesis protein [Bacillus sp. SL00103]